MNKEKSCQNPGLFLRLLWNMGGVGREGGKGPGQPLLGQKSRLEGVREFLGYQPWVIQQSPSKP